MRTASRLIVEALACVAREVPAAHAQMRAALGPRTIALAIGDELLHVALDDTAAGGEPSITVEMSIDALTDLLAGGVELVDAVGARRVDVWGDPDDLVAASDALRWFLEGAVRCLSIEPLADELFALRGGET